MAATGDLKIETTDTNDSLPTAALPQRLQSFALTDDDFRRRLSPVLESSRQSARVPGLKSLWRDILDVVER